MNPESLNVEQNEHIPSNPEIQEESVPVIDPATTLSEINEAIENRVSSVSETEDKIAALRAELGATGETAIPSVDIAKQNIEQLTNEKNALEGVASQEGFAENNILNQQILDRVTQLEAINPNTGEFDQDRYDEYMNGQAKLGAYSVGANQEKIKTALNNGRTMEQATRRGIEAVYGIGGWNRYVINPDGSMKLSRGSSVTTGSDAYKAVLEEKAKDFGFEVGL